MIAHVSDMHIRNLKYHDEYRRAFDDLYFKLRELRPDIVVNSGDSAHTKTQISPEFVEIFSDHVHRVSEIAPYHIILGNHDMNLMNADRQDAITPIVSNIKVKNVYIHKKSGLGFTLENGGQRYNFWVFSLADQKNYPTRSSWTKYPDDVNIGLFHGSVMTCVTDMNWRMTHVEHDLSIFDGLDFALLGDIHKQQFFKDRTIGYAGSLVQQNFGEEIDKGFLLWDIGMKGEEHHVTSHIVRGSRPFYTIKINDDLSIPETSIIEDARIRISPPRAMTLTEQRDVEKDVIRRFHPHDVITLSAANIGEQRMTIGKMTTNVENIRQISVQERLIRDFFKDDHLPENIMTRIVDLNRRYQMHLDKEDTNQRNISWKIDRIAWSGLFNYGSSNIIDFSRIGGLTGIFGQNGIGKSNIIDVILETCFDSITKGINKNISIINDNKDVAAAIVEFTVNEQKYEIERRIERIKDKTNREWGKTSTKFSMVDEVGGKEELTGVSRPETENTIRQMIGTFDDFMLTSLLAQANPLDIISAKETKRKEIIFKFLDLDTFGQKAMLAKDESRDLFRQLQELNEDDASAAAERLRLSITEKETRLDNITKTSIAVSEKIVDLEEKILLLRSTRIDDLNQDHRDWLSEIGNVDEKIRKNDVRLQERISYFKDLSEKLTKILSIPKSDLDLLDRKSKEHQVVHREIVDLERSIEEKRTLISGWKKSAALLNEVPCGDSFPTCKFLINAFKAKNNVPTAEMILVEFEKKLTVMRADRDKLFVFVKELEEALENKVIEKKIRSDLLSVDTELNDIKLHKTSLKNEREHLEHEREKYNGLIERIGRNDEIDARCRCFMDEKQLLQKSFHDLQRDINDLHRSIGADTGVLTHLDAQLSKVSSLKEECLSFEHFLKAMGKDGITYQILVQKLPLINEEMNKILSSVTDFSVTLEHDTEEQSIRFYVQYGQYKRRLLELEGGAAKFLVSIAIRAALMNISILPKTNVMIIDEGFGKLDPKNIESIQRMFDYLKTVFDHVIIISHLDVMRDMVDNIIEINVDDEGYAHVGV